MSTCLYPRRDETTACGYAHSETTSTVASDRNTGTRGPRPVVTFDGQTYTCKRWKVEVPDLDSMSPIEARIWLVQNTTPRGHQLRSAVNLHGYASAARLIVPTEAATDGQ
ncbi:hypothetical protein [Nocardia fluminea]|uniref:hypothetical protein n=1 Tax=Nocardia fluminea TaxID=134984 RepID=UPI003653549D